MRWRRVNLGKGRCRHCGEVFDRQECVECRQAPVSECVECHMELAHGKVSNQNVHFVGIPGLKVNRPDYDQDAYGYVDSE